MRSNRKGARKALAILLFVVLFVSGLSFAGAETRARVRIGVYDMPGFCYRDVTGGYIGYGMDYLNAVLNQTNWDYELVEIKGFNDGMEKLAAHEIDLLSPAQITEKRLEQFAFSEYSFGTEFTAVITNSSHADLAYEDWDSYDGLTAAASGSYLITDYFLALEEEHGFTCRMDYYDTPEMALAAMRTGKADLCVANLIEVQEGDRVLSRFQPKPFYFMTWKGNDEVLAALNEAMANLQIMQPTLLSDLMAAWLPMYEDRYLTREQMDYAATLGTLNVGYVTDRIPVSYQDEAGELAGMTRAILDRLQKLTGLTFNYVPLPEGAVTYDFLRDNHITLVTSVEYNSLNAGSDGLKLTQPYIGSSKVFVTARDMTFDRAANYTVAIDSGSQSIRQVILSNYPSFTLLDCDSLADCFTAVLEGRADALMLNQYTAEYWLDKPLYSSLHTIAAEGLADDLCCAVIAYQAGAGQEETGMEAKLLTEILDVGISQLSRTELSGIVIKACAEKQYREDFGDFLERYRQTLYPLGASVALILVLAVFLVRQRRRSFEAIRLEEVKLRNITRNINGGVMVLVPDKGFRITYANEGLLAILGYTPGERDQVLGADCVTLVHPDDLAQLEGMQTGALGLGRNVTFRMRMQKRDGSFVETLFSGTLTEGESGTEIYCVVMDMTAQAAMQEALDIQRKRYEFLMEKSEDIKFEVDLRTGGCTCSDYMTRKLGWHLPPTIDLTDPAALTAAWAVLPEDRGRLTADFEAVAREGVSRETEARLKGANGAYLWCRIVRYPILDKEGKPAAILGKIEDIHAEMMEKEALEARSRIDPMTGLMNKQTFLTETQAWLDGGENKSAALIFLDMDHFKTINDTLGHIAGDKAILTVARKLQVIYANYDAVARFGGDEFCIFVKDIPLETLQEKLRRSVGKLKDKVMGEDGREAALTVSIGASYAARAGGSIRHMLDEADKALYQAKDAGRAQFALRRMD